MYTTSQTSYIVLKRRSKSTGLEGSKVTRISNIIMNMDWTSCKANNLSERKGTFFKDVGKAPSIFFHH